MIPDAYADKYEEAISKLLKKIDELEAKARAARIEGLRSGINVVDSEPEYPGDIPKEMYYAIINGDDKTVAEIMRTTVRLTKQGIKKRIDAEIAALERGKEK